MPEQRQITLDDVKNFIRQMTPNPDYLYIILPYSVGDFFNIGGLSLAVQKKKNKSATVLIVKDRLKNLGVTYENFAGIIFLPENIMALICRYIYATGNYEGDNYIYGHFRIKSQSGEYVWDESLNLIDRYKQDVFKIPMDTPYTKPVVPPLTDENIAALRGKYTLDTERTIIICPYAHSVKNINDTHWKNLARKLKNKNYIVYTNVAGDEKSLAGTKPLHVNLSELNFIADKVKCFIGLRSGIFDFLAMTGAKIFCIDTFPWWWHKLNILYPECNCKTIYNAVDYISPLGIYFKEDDVNCQLKLSHPHIDAEDVCYSYEEIFNKVLNEIEKV